jgi:hypothetical protein
MYDPGTINGYSEEKSKGCFFVIHETREFSVFQYFLRVLFLKLPAHFFPIVKTLP